MLWLILCHLWRHSNTLLIIYVVYSLLLSNVTSLDWNYISAHCFSPAISTFQQCQDISTSMFFGIDIFLVVHRIFSNALSATTYIAKTATNIIYVYTCILCHLHIVFIYESIANLHLVVAHDNLLLAQHLAQYLLPRLCYDYLLRQPRWRCVPKSQRPKARLRRLPADVASNLQSLPRSISARWSRKKDKWTSGAISFIMIAFVFVNARVNKHRPKSSLKRDQYHTVCAKYEKEFQRQCEREERLRRSRRFWHKSLKTHIVLCGFLATACSVDMPDAHLVGHDIQCLAAHSVILSLQSTNATVATDVVHDHRCDSDSFQIAIDNCSTRCITNDARDFIDQPRPMSVKIKGVSGCATSTLVGTVRWAMQDDEGVTHQWTIPNVCFQPSSPCRLLALVTLSIVVATALGAISG